MAASTGTDTSYIHTWGSHRYTTAGRGKLIKVAIVNGQDSPSANNFTCPMCLGLGHYFCKEPYFGDMLFSVTTGSPIYLLLQFVDWHPCGGMVCVCV